MATHLLDLPPELIEHVLAVLAHQDASSLAACRQTCRSLNAAIEQSQLVRYIERAALLGVYDPFVPVADADIGAAAVVEGADGAPTTTTTMTIPERAAALEAWNKAWSTLDDVLCTRKPDLRFAMPSRDELRTGRTAEVGAPGSATATGTTTTSSTGSTGSPPSGSATAEALTAAIRAAEAELEQRLWEMGEDDWHCHFSFGPWFVAAAREGAGVRAGYSYLDVHGSLGRGGRGRGRVAEDPEKDTTKEGEGVEDEGEDEGTPRWTTINVPVRNIVVFALSTELDLAVAISARVEREESGETITSHVEVRPLRFKDGTPHPCAEVPTIRLSATGASAHNMAQTQVLGDYLLLWIGGPHEEDYSLCKLYLVAWKRGSVTLLRDNPAGKYGSIGTMISEDVFALVQLKPPGIELSRISNFQCDSNGGDGGAPRMDKLCTLLLPPLQEGARPDWAVCVGEHPGHQPFSRGPWPAYRRAPPRRQFRQSTRDSIVSVVMQITGSERHMRIFDIVVRSATLLAHAAKVESSSPGGGQEERPTRADADADADDEDDDDVNCVPWSSWGPRETSMSDHTSFEWNDLLGERRATVDLSGHGIRIYDYNPYRIRQARTSGVAKVHRVGHVGGGGGEGEGQEQQQQQQQSGDSDEGEEEANRSHRNGSRRITETSTIKKGQWFRDDVSTALPHLDTVIYKPGCRAIYMEQDQLLLHVDDMNDHARWPNGSRRLREGFVLYRM